MRKVILLTVVAFAVTGCASRAKLEPEPMTPLKDFRQFRSDNRENSEFMWSLIGRNWDGTKELVQWAKRLEGNGKFIWFSLVTYAAQTDRNFKLLLSALKRRGIKIDLKREAELLEQETKLKQKNQRKK